MSTINLHYVQAVDNNGKSTVSLILEIYEVIPELRKLSLISLIFILLALRDKAIAKALRLCSRDLSGLTFIVFTRSFLKMLVALQIKTFKFSKLLLTTAM